MKSRIKKVIFFNIILMVIFFGYYFLNTNFNIGLECLFHKLSHLYCPGCGITRCLFSIIHLKFNEAFHYNMFVFILLPFLAIYYIYAIYVYIFDKKDNLIKKIPDYYYYILVFLAILFGVLRNTETFKFLAP